MSDRYPKDGLLDLILHLKYPDGTAPAAELTHLLDAWEQAKQGQEQVSDEV